MLALIVAAALTIGQHDPRYPAHWWTPAPTQGKPAWEILPQEAKPGEVILSKRNELGLLMMLYPENDRDPRATAKGIGWKFTREKVRQNPDVKKVLLYELLTRIRSDLLHPR